MHAVQYGLLKILSRTLAALRHFTPDVCQILLDQVPAVPQPPCRAACPGARPGCAACFFTLQSLDLAEYNFLFALSFTTPTFDSEVAPSFGTLLATVNVTLNMLGEVSRGCRMRAPTWLLPARLPLPRDLAHFIQPSCCST